MAGMSGGSGTSSGSSSGWSKSSSKIEVPDWLEPLAGQTATNIAAYQNLYPLAGNAWGQGTPESTNFFEANPKEIAEVDPLQNWVSENVLSLWNEPTQRDQTYDYISKAADLSGKLATGENIESSPAILAASEAFDKLNLPEIENQMGLSGLGKSSSLANAIALGKTEYMLPMIQDELSREQESYTNQANMYSTLASTLEGMGENDVSRQLSTLGAAAEQGATMRGIEQETLDAEYNDFLRRQALTEQLLFGSFTETGGESIGPSAKSESQQTSSTSSKTSSGFK